MKKDSKKIALGIVGGLFLCCVGGTTLGLLLPDTEKAPAPASTPDKRGIIGTPIPTATRDVAAEEKQEAAAEEAADKKAAEKKAAGKKAQEARAARRAADKKRQEKEAAERRDLAEQQEQEDEDTGGGAAYYANCTAARAAGAAPLHRGDAGYRSGLDRDGDGVACE